MTHSAAALTRVTAGVIRSEVASGRRRAGTESCLRHRRSRTPKARRRRRRLRIILARRATNKMRLRRLLAKQEKEGEVEEVMRTTGYEASLGSRLPRARGLTQRCSGRKVSHPSTAKCRVRRTDLSVSAVASAALSDRRWA